MQPASSLDAPPKRPRTWTLTCLVAALGGVAGWLVDATHLPTWIGATLVAFLGTAFFAWGQRLARTSGEQLQDEAQASAPLVEGVLPVWQRHIDTARRHSEESIGQILASFGTINDRLEEAIRFTQGQAAATTTRSVDAMLRDHDGAFQAMLEPMREMQSSRDEVLDRLDEIGKVMTHLRQSAVQIKQLARRTTMVALNASVEASRAGQDGSGFAVVAAEVQQLATQSGQVAQQMMSRTSTVEEQIASLRVRSAVLDRGDDALQVRAEAAARVVVADLLGDLSHLSRTSRELQSAGNAVQEEVERVLMNFQSQDRLSQMLDCVTTDMQLMSDWLASGSDVGVTQIEQWLERLDASYTMEEQRAEHHGNAAIQRETAIEFF